MITDIEYSPKQKTAIDKIMEWYFESNKREFYLFGYAGTGKTTIVKEIMKQIKERRKEVNIITATYTGKAAIVLKQKGCDDSMTIHNMIYYAIPDGYGGFRFKLGDKTPANDADLIILDECSMVGKKLANDIRYYKKKMLIIGDPGQLPPIGSDVGEFITNSPDVFLDEIHRQAADSPIIDIATKARLGIPLVPGNYGDVQIISMAGRPAQELIDLVTRPDTQVIVGLHTSRIKISKYIRDSLGYYGAIPSPGETILCCKNNHTEQFYNGMQGIVANCTDIVIKNPQEDEPRTYYSMDIQFDSEKGLRTKLKSIDNMFIATDKGIKLTQDVRTNYQHYESFDFGYVLTCHKAQGSQWDDITIVDDSQYFRENKSKWLYTAITRSCKKLTIILR